MKAKTHGPCLTNMQTTITPYLISGLVVKQWWTGRANCQRKGKKLKESKEQGEYYLIWIHEKKQRS
jgi:glucose-6-phosphate dehydrogenase assembly protein OpcA